MEKVSGPRSISEMEQGRGIFRTGVFWMEKLGVGRLFDRHEH